MAFELDEEEEEEEAGEEADEAEGAMATAPPIRSRTRTGRRTALVKPSWSAGCGLQVGMGSS